MVHKNQILKLSHGCNARLLEGPIDDEFGIEEAAGRVAGITRITKGEPA
jgi:hypothetical protein